MMSPQMRVIQDVIAERFRQDTKWGVQNHAPETWLMVLGEEVGEANKAALEYRFPHGVPLTWTAYRDELIQVAAVAIAAIESLDRNEMRGDE